MVADPKQNNSIDRLVAQITWQRSVDVQVAVLDLSLWPRTTDLLLLLSPSELAESESKPAGAEQDHFVRRRVFQRLFVRHLLCLEVSPGDVPLLHARDKRPRSPIAPGQCLSFSTAGDIAMAAASTTCVIGVDVERLRPVPNAAALGGRFFSRQEVLELRNTPQSDQSSVFIRLWSAKEACLKAFGTGVVEGLEKFQFSFENGNLRLELTPSETDRQHWRVEPLQVPEGYVAFLAKLLKR